MIVLAEVPGGRTQWVAIDDEWFAETFGEVEPGECPVLPDEWDGDTDFYRVVGEDDYDLSLSEAMQIADIYGGGEFDGEMGAVVVAMLTLRDALKVLS